MGDIWHEVKDWLILIIGGFVTWNHNRQSKAEDRISELEKTCVTKADLNYMQDKLDGKLDRILDKLDQKADK